MLAFLGAILKAACGMPWHVPQSLCSQLLSYQEGAQLQAQPQSNVDYRGQ